jgi:hypothetical protein
MFGYLLAATVTYVGYALYGDQQIRDEDYTKPLGTMPDNARELAEQMLSAEINSHELSEQEIAKVRLEILEILSQGAVAQRNHEMDMVRDKISYFGYLLSWFLKQKGLSYEQITEKYRLQFDQDAQGRHMAIIESASRANPSVFDKLVHKLTHMVGAS